MSILAKSMVGNCQATKGNYGSKETIYVPIMPYEGGFDTDNETSDDLG
jgi:hypothetical protein